MYPDEVHDELSTALSRCFLGSVTYRRRRCRSPPAPSVFRVEIPRSPVSVFGRGDSRRAPTRNCLWYTVFRLSDKEPVAQSTNTTRDVETRLNVQSPVHWVVYVDAVKAHSHQARLRPSTSVDGRRRASMCELHCLAVPSRYLMALVESTMWVLLLKQTRKVPQK